MQIPLGGKANCNTNAKLMQQSTKYIPCVSSLAPKYNKLEKEALEECATSPSKASYLQYLLYVVFVCISLYDFNFDVISLPNQKHFVFLVSFLCILTLSTQNLDF